MTGAYHKFSKWDRTHIVFESSLGEKLISKIKKAINEFPEKEIIVVLFNVEQAESVYSFIKDNSLQVFASEEVKEVLESQDFKERMYARA